MYGQIRPPSTLSPDEYDMWMEYAREMHKRQEEEIRRARSQLEKRKSEEKVKDPEDEDQHETPGHENSEPGTQLLAEKQQREDGEDHATQVLP